MSVVYIALGSNLGNRAFACKRALREIATLPQTFILATSIFFETDPVDFLDQPKFVNGIIKIETKLSPLDLLSYLLNIEKKMGRTREKKWGPRIIDLDIIDYENVHMQSKELEIPHPRAFQRDFIKKSLCELGLYSGISTESSSSSSLVNNGQMSKAKPNTKSVSPS